ncbi:MAG: hypothetical protein QM817_19420 [Archangium sp.]
MRRALSIITLLASGCLEPALTQDAGVNDAGPVHCSPLTCTGCCRGDVCLGGNTDDACGYDGRSCKACAAQLTCKSPGACFLNETLDAGGEAVIPPAVLERPNDPFTGQPLIDPPRNRCVWVFGFPVCD